MNTGDNFNTMIQMTTHFQKQIQIAQGDCMNLYLQSQNKHNQQNKTPYNMPHSDTKETPKIFEMK